MIDFSDVSFLDSAANVIAGVVRKATHHGVKIYVTGASLDVRKELSTHDVRASQVTFLARIEDAVGAVHRLA